MSSNLSYNIASGKLTGRLGSLCVSIKAGSGGRAGSKIAGAENWHLKDNPFSTHIGGSKSAGTHIFGSLPIGVYALRLHESRKNWIRLVPGPTSNLHGRAGFAIHGRGRVGSHGCIVVPDFNLLKRMCSAVEARQKKRWPPYILRAHATGQDLDRKFRTA